jgi:tyrosine-protein kinase Etk/Wzc
VTAERTPKSAPGELDLRDYWRIARRRWKVIALVTTLIFVAGATATFLQRPMYRGETTVLVEDLKSTQLDVLEGLSGLGGPIPVETEMEILKSRTIAETVVSELGLDAIPQNAPTGTRFRLLNYRSAKYPPAEKPIFRIDFDETRTYTVYSDEGEKLGSGVLGEEFVGDGVSWSLQVTAPTRLRSLRVKKIPFQTAVTYLQDSITVREVGKKTNVITVTVDAGDPFAVRDIADEITAAYLAYNFNRKSQVASQTLDFIGKQLASVQGNLDKGEEELGAYKSEAGIIVLSDSAKSVIEQISKLETARADIDLQERDVSALSAAIEHAGERDSPYMLGEVSLPDPVVGRLVSELSKSLIEIRALRQEFAEDSPKVALLKAQIDEAKAKVRMAVQNAAKSLRSRRETATRLIEGYEDRLKKLPENERKLAFLTRKSEVNAELYTFLLKKHEEARIMEAGIVSNVRVLDKALVPDRPESPKKRRNLALFLFLGGLAGVLCAFLLEYLDDTLKNIDEIASVLDLAVYGVIPFAEIPESEQLNIMRLDPRGSIQEAFRSFRTNIQFTDSEHRIKSIVAVSALPGVGKSTTIANLGVILAQGGSRVLVVDCDLRRPRVHLFFDVPCEPGLTNGFLADKDWRTFVHERVGVERLHFLPAGVLPPNPAEFLGSHRFQEFMREAGEAYDYVLYDVPPIIAFTDAALLAARADAVFLVLELGRSQVPLLRRSLELLGNVQAKVRGAVVNKAGQLGNADQAYGYYYASGYQYYYDSDAHRAPGTLAKLWARIVR